ncbi:MAG TPA: MFS transporter [Pseudonocardiaceae bacterium]|nr:MFS transporter [Pseudonocardiaceae bacterium]
MSIAWSGSRRRWAFWLGTVLVLVGAGLHFPDYAMAGMDHYRMTGMAMGSAMTIGMVLIVVGLAAAVWALFPARPTRPEAERTVPRGQFAALEQTRLTRAHWGLIAVLTIGMVVDTMKPASLGFVVPGMVKEYGLAKSTVALLPFVAISGTVLGSLLWGYLADVFGRRATILLSTLIYVASSICGFMPSFGWNLVMCLIMGASAGGMLPTVYSLMSESMPAKKRGWLIVGQAGLGTALGYLAASGAATLLAPTYSWRILWLIGAPTGLLLLALSRWIPESPRFLFASGRPAQARAVMARYGISEVPHQQEEPVEQPALVKVNRTSTGTLFQSPLARRTIPILLYGLSWGVINWTFITFLPTLLQQSQTGVSASALLFRSELFALPTSVLAAVLYARWSSKKTLLLFAGSTFLVLAAFPILNATGVGDQSVLVALLVVLLSSSNGMIATLAPYVTEVYPTDVRATASGLAAAASKVGGLSGPLLLTAAPTISGLALVCAVPVGVAGLVLSRTGTETAGRPLVEVVEPA